MSLFQRVILTITSLMLVSASLPYVLFRDVYFHVNPTKMYFYIVVGFAVAVYNLIIIFKESNTKHYLVEDEELKEKIDRLHKSRRSDEL